MLTEKKLPQYVELKLFVGSIPKQWDDKKVKDFFQHFGNILDVTMITKKSDHKGSAFVRFQSMTEAEKTIIHFQEKSSEIGGIVVKWADGEKERLGLTDDQAPKIYVGSLPKDCDDSDIKGLFEPYGQIVDLQVANKGAINQSAYITYQNRESCVLAIRNLNNAALMHGQPMEIRFVTGNLPTTQPRVHRYDQPMAIEQSAQDPDQDPIQEYMKSYTRWLDQKKKPYYVHWETGEIRKQVPPLGSIIHSPDGTKESVTREKYLNDLAAFNSKKTGPSGSNLFVFHLPNDHKDSDLMELFQPYGNVISARVMTEPKTGKSKGFGFVSFDKPEGASKAKEAMDGFLVEKKKLSVTFKQNDGSSHPLHLQSLPSIRLIQFDPYDW